MFDGAYAGKRVFITGHTGFKGSWLARWLTRLGAEVHGFALEPPTDPSHFALLPRDYESRTGDIRDREALRKALADADPHAVFHLAAQPLVCLSYREPLETLAANVMGTAHLLDACREASNLRAVVVVTSDKCYENREWVHGYREPDPLGGHDPYSASKACAEIVTASYRRSFFGEPGGALVASVRAGNVLGGGDWAEDRLVPDMVRAAAAGGTTLIRNPSSVRPWQHVLDPLCGYLQLGARLMGGEAAFADAWNFGPGVAGFLTAGEIAGRMAAAWDAVRCEFPPGGSAGGPHEAGLLALDSSKARRLLGWSPLYAVDECVDRTVVWYRAWHEDGQVATDAQIDEYEAALAARGGAGAAR